MKKFKLILINLLILTLTLFIIEGIIWLNANETLRKLGDLKAESPNFPFHPGIQTFYLDFNSFPHKSKDFEYGRQPVGLEYKKQPILIFGCSYAYGHNLENNQTFSYNLSQNAKVPVYNRAHSGWGIQHMLYQTEHDEFYSKVPEPSHAIYVYIPNHIQRLYYYYFEPYGMLMEIQNLRYEEQNGKLIEVNKNNKLSKQIERLYSINKINNFLIHKYTLNNKLNKKCYDFAFKHFSQSRSNMQKHWTNTKYVILFYTASERDKYLKEKLKENNFIVLDAEELSNKDLWDKEFMREDVHPTEKAWDVVVPQLTKELGI